VLVTVGRLHQPDYSASLFGQVALGALALMSWLAAVTHGLAGVQVLLALWLYRKLPFAPDPARWVGVAHRLTGVVLIAVTLPVAVHCLIAYGVRLSPLRVAVHSLAGCFLYGAFAAKVLLVQSRRLPGWALPVAGHLGGRPVVQLRLVVLRRLPAASPLMRPGPVADLRRVLAVAAGVGAAPDPRVGHELPQVAGR